MRTFFAAAMTAFIFVFVLIILVSFGILPLDKRDVKVGDKYELCYDYDDLDNCFEPPDIDTITILGVCPDGKYVKYGYKFNHTDSTDKMTQVTELSWLNKTKCLIRKIN